MKTYRYQKHFRWTRYLGPLLLVFLAASILKLGLSDSDQISSVAIACGSIILLEAVWLWWMADRMVHAQVTLTDDTIIYRGKKKKTEIHLAEITKIKYPSIPYAGGWIKILSQEKAIRLTVALNGISDFVRELKDSLDRSQLSEKYDRARLFRFYKTAEYADQSWERLREYFGRALPLLVLGGAVGFVAGLIREPNRWGQRHLFESTLVIPVLILIGCAITEFIFARRIAKLSDEAEFKVPARDSDFETTVCGATFAVGATLALFAALLIVVV